jgi:hypothetical protein
MDSPENFQNGVSGPFVYSNGNRGDLPFTFDVVNPQNAHKMFGTYYVCLDALSVWVPAGRLTIYGFGHQSYLDPPNPWKCS